VASQLKPTEVSNIAAQ